MIVRLHNLAARPPHVTDLEAVTTLMAVCEMAESGISDCTKEDVRETWQTPGFSMKNDAWIITNNKGQIVGYADVRQQGHPGQFVATTLVHPDYRDRGIGVLLIWLQEERARQLAYAVSQHVPVTLRNSLSDMDQGAHLLLDREGYTHARSYWRLVIEMDETQDGDELQPQGKFKVDLVVDPQQTMGTGRSQRRTGLYIARQYNVYEKVVRAGSSCATESGLQREVVGA